mmetsp:Transcript_24527/g.61751  ORF Transcript_24527/g.61751 Transcript_24527/m.61751 type:complete len:184 (-) Transcript_24527:317-868(-)
MYALMTRLFSTRVGATWLVLAYMRIEAQAGRSGGGVQGQQALTVDAVVSPDHGSTQLGEATSEHDDELEEDEAAAFTDIPTDDVELDYDFDYAEPDERGSSYMAAIPGCGSGKNGNETCLDECTGGAGQRTVTTSTSHHRRRSSSKSNSTESAANSTDTDPGADEEVDEQSEKSANVADAVEK